MIVVGKSYREGHVGIRIDLKASGYSGGSVSVQGSTEISSTEARSLAGDLIRSADEADAKLAKKAAAEERRQKWRDREVAAGRLKIFNTSEFLR